MKAAPGKLLKAAMLLIIVVMAAVLFMLIDRPATGAFAWGDELLWLALFLLAALLIIAWRLLPDVSKREELAQAALKIQSRYRALAEMSPVGIFYTDVQGYTTYVNPQWCRISGMTSEKALGNGWLNAVHPEDKKELFEGWMDAAQHREQSVAEYRFIHPDGEIRWVMGEAIPERDTDDNIIGYVGTVTDITKRKKAEEDLRKEKLLSDSLVNSLPGAFYLYTQEGKFLRWNRNFQEVCGYSADEIRHMHPLDFFPEDEKDLIGGKIDNVFIYGHDTVEAHFVLKSGKKIPYYFTGKAIEYEGKLCLMGVGIDISKRVEAQEKTRQTSGQLRQLAAHLQDVREEERAAMAREIHDELGQLLTGLKMDVYWLREEMQSPAGETLKQIEGILQLLDQTIGTVRKISASLRPPILDDLGLVEALKLYAEEFQKRYNIDVQFHTRLSELSVSPKKSIGLFRIFQESLTNVARHAEASRVVCSLELSGADIVLTIQDNGKGFDIEKAVRKKTLGLVGMEERTLMMEGKYAINTRPGAGTEVVVMIPLQPVAV